MKKNIYFVQVGFEFDGSVYLPYAAGTIIAYCKSRSEISEVYAFPDIIYKREKLADALERLEKPYIVAFSCSVWNTEYNKALARLVKEKYPSCLTVFTSKRNALLFTSRLTILSTVLAIFVTFTKLFS